MKSSLLAVAPLLLVAVCAFQAVAQEPSDGVLAAASAAANPVPATIGSLQCAGWPTVGNATFSNCAFRNILSCCFGTCNAG